MKQTVFLENLIAKAKSDIKTIVLPEGEDERILQAAHAIAEMKAAKLVILGNKEEIETYFAKNGWNMDGIEIIVPENSEKLEQYAETFYEMRKDKGISKEDALKQMHNYNYFGTMMIKAGDADGMVSGANHSTADTVRPALFLPLLLLSLKTNLIFFQIARLSLIQLLKNWPILLLTPLKLLFVSALNQK